MLKLDLNLKITENLGEVSDKSITIPDIKLNLHECISFYERDSGKSFIEKDIPMDPNSAFFEFFFSGSDCDDMTF